MFHHRQQSGTTSNHIIVETNEQKKTMETIEREEFFQIDDKQWMM